MCCETGISDAVLNVPMAQILLNRARIDAFVGEVVARPVPKHVWMRRGGGSLP